MYLYPLAAPMVQSLSILEPILDVRCSPPWGWPCCQVTSVVSDSVRPHRQQPSRLHCPWDSPGKNTGVGCHFLLQCMKVKSESEVTQSCPTPSNPMDCSLPGSSTHGIFQARVLEWGAIAFSNKQKMAYLCYISWGIAWRTKWLQNNKNI